MNTRLHWWQFVRRFQRWLRVQFDKWIQDWQAGRTWGPGFQCRFCSAVLTKKARFCTQCGADQQPTTEPIVLSFPHTGDWRRYYFRQVRPDLAPTEESTITTAQLKTVDTELLLKALKQKMEEAKKQ